MAAHQLADRSFVQRIEADRAFKQRRRTARFTIRGQLRGPGLQELGTAFLQSAPAFLRPSRKPILGEQLARVQVQSGRHVTNIGGRLEGVDVDPRVGHETSPRDRTDRGEVARRA
jgi:hypothetical protein